MIGKKLRELRELKKLSMNDVYKKTGITNSRLSRIETDEEDSVKLNDLKALLSLYETSIYGFLCETGYCNKMESCLSNLEKLDLEGIKHIQNEVDFILKYRG